MKKIPFNLNYNIHVKMPQSAYPIHRKWWDNTYSSEFHYQYPRENSDGLTTFQMYEFMQIFGHVVNIFVFHVTIEVEDDR